MKKTIVASFALLTLAVAPAQAAFIYRQAAPGLAASSHVAPPETPAAAKLTLSASTVSLSSPQKGVAAPAQTLSVSNTGTAPLTIALSSLTGVNAADFTVGGCTSPVAAGGSCTLTFGFTPSQSAAESAALVITDTASGTAYPLTLAGLNTGPELSLASSSVTLSSTLKGVAAPAQQLTVANTGNSPLTVSLSSLTGLDAADFTVSGCASPIPAGGNCKLSFGFTPTKTTAEAASLVLTDTSTNTAHTISLVGQNTGPVDPYLSSVTFLGRMDDGTFSDAMGNVVTNTGSVTWDPTGGMWGGAATFNGSNRLSTTSSTAFNFGTGDFTVEVSFFFTSSAGTGAACANLVGDGYMWQLCPSMAYIGWWNYGRYATQTWPYTFNTNTWYTIAISRTSGTLRAYVNGSLVGTATDTYSVPLSASKEISIGNVPALGQAVRGRVDQVRITKGVSRYTGSSYTVAPFPYQ